MFLFFILEKQLKTTIVNMPTETIFYVPKNMKTLFSIMVWEFFFFPIIMRVHIATNKCTVNKKTKIKNKQKYTNIDKTKSIKKHYLNYYIGKWRLGEWKSSWLIYGSKAKEKKSELQWSNNWSEKLSVSKTHLMQAFIISLHSLKL